MNTSLIIFSRHMRYRIEHKDSDNKWHTLDSGESEDSFILDDGSGQCVIDPCAAEILTTH